MLNLVRFLRVLIIVFISILGAFKIAPAVACTSDEITLSDGTCKPVQFTMTIGNFPSDGADFTFYVSAKGKIYVDWGMDMLKQKI